MQRLVLITLFLLNVLPTFSQTDSLGLRRCKQYQAIIKSIVDTSNLKFYERFGENITEIVPKVVYKHYVMRKYIKFSFTDIRKRSPELFSDIDPDRRSNTDSIRFTSEFQNERCIQLALITNKEANVSVIFDRYNEHTVFVHSAYIRKGSSFGLVQIYWFDKDDKFICKSIGFQN
jgi:hypothetical protein